MLYTLSSLYLFLYISRLFTFLDVSTAIFSFFLEHCIINITNSISLYLLAFLWAKWNRISYTFSWSFLFLTFALPPMKIVFHAGFLLTSNKPLYTPLIISSSLFAVRQYYFQYPFSFHLLFVEYLPFHYTFVESSLMYLSLSWFFPTFLLLINITPMFLLHGFCTIYNGGFDNIILVYASYTIHIKDPFMGLKHVEETSVLYILKVLIINYRKYVLLNWSLRKWFYLKGQNSS